MANHKTLVTAQVWNTSKSEQVAVSGVVKMPQGAQAWIEARGTGNYVQTSWFAGFLITTY
jgi:hypothetical protein